MADAKPAKKKGTRKAGPRFSVRLQNDAGVGLKISTAYDYRNKLFRVQPTVWTKGFGKGIPHVRVESKTIGAEFPAAEEAVKAMVTEAEEKGWARVPGKGTAAYAEIPAATDVEAE